MSTQVPVSFEFFPPKTPEGMARLGETRAALAAFAPEFCSVTYGAGGSTREPTLATVLMLHAAGAAVAPHLSFGGDDAKGVERLLDQYRAAGIRRLVALRGDLPSGVGGSAQLVHANELVALIRERADMRIGVAAFPEGHVEATDLAQDARVLLDLGCEVDAWETTYLHVLRGPDPVLSWVRGTVLLPVPVIGARSTPSAPRW